MLTSAQTKDLKETGGLNNIKELIKNEIEYFHLYRFPKDVKNYKQYLGFNIDRLEVIEDWQANISYPISRSIVDTTFANMYDFGYEFGVLDPTFRRILNQTFDFRNQGRKCIKDLIKEGLITGKSFCRTGIIKEEVEIQLGIGVKIKEVVKKPTIEYISKFNIYYDHNYSVFNSPYVIIRDLLTGFAIKKKYKGYLSNIELVKLQKILNKNSEINQNELQTNGCFSQFDFNPVKDILSYQNNFVEEIMRMKKSKRTNGIVAARDYFSGIGLLNTGLEGNNSHSKGNISAKNLFKYDASKSYEVIEYEENGKITLFVNGEKVTQYDSLLRGMGKIREVEFNSIPGTSESLGLMDHLGEMQTLLDSIWNGFIDNIKLQLTGMFKVKGNVGGVGQSKMNFNKFGLLRIKGDADIQRFEMGLGDFMPLNVVQYVEGFMAKMAGVNDYHLGGQHKVERVTSGIDFMRSQYKSKLAVMIDSIQSLMSDTSKEWMLIYLMKYDEDELKDLGLTFTVEKSVKGKSKIETHLVNGLDIGKILNEENISFTYNALETIDMERDRERIMTLFQPLAQNGLVSQDELWNVALGKKFDSIWKKKNRELDVGADGKSIKSGDATIAMEQELKEPYYDDSVTSQYNSSTIAKTPGGAKLRDITKELNTRDITDNLSI